MSIKIALIPVSAVLSVTSTFVLFANGLGEQRIRELSAYFQATRDRYWKIGVITCSVLLPAAIVISVALLLAPYTPRIWDGGGRIPLPPLYAETARLYGSDQGRAYYELLWPMLHGLFSYVGFITLSILILVIFMFSVRGFTSFVLSSLIGPRYIELGLAGFVIAMILAVVTAMIAPPSP